LARELTAQKLTVGEPSPFEIKQTEARKRAQQLREAPDPEDEPKALDLSLADLSCSFDNDNVKKWLPECWSPDHTPGILMIPINKNLHWFLISVDFARREISLYDSMTDHSHIATQAFKVMTIHNI
jgi:hypothetical protein